MNTIIEFKAVDILQKNNIIFQNINFKISAGEFIYIIGKTGSGKSSLLKSLYAELSCEEIFELGRLRAEMLHGDGVGLAPVTATIVSEIQISNFCK